MKKITAIMTVTALAFAVTACGGKGEKVETEAVETSAAQAAEESSGIELPEDYEPQFFEGIVTNLDGSKITLTSDGTSMTFDMSKAELDENSTILTGSDVEVEYAEAEDDVKPAVTVTLLMDIEQQAGVENRDPQIYGTLSTYDINDITIVDEAGVERTFDNQMSRMVAFNELKPGDTVVISYSGSILDDGEDDEDEVFSQPIAIKVVALDALDSEDAKANYFTGTVDSINAAVGIVTIINEIAEFEVVASEDMIANLNEEEEVKVYYDGALSGLSVEATKIEKIGG